MDGAFDPDILKGSHGVVIRGPNGRLVTAGNREIDWSGDALMVEALA